MNLPVASKLSSTPYRRPSMITTLPHQSSLNSQTLTLTHPNHSTHNQNAYLLQVIEQYRSQAQINEQTEEQKQESNDLGVDINGNGVGGVGGIEDISVESYTRNGLRPLCCYKDLMELKKENMEKKQIVKNLQQINQKLKLQYHNSLTNNKKMQSFLKQIEFTFKNDRQTHPKPHACNPSSTSTHTSNPSSHQRPHPHPHAHRANETLMKATKTLHRQKHQSRKYIEKLTKNVKSNQMRELKCYLKVLENQKKRIGGLLRAELEENARRREQEDFNESQLQCFQYCQNLVAQILQSGLRYTSQLRHSYSSQKSTIKTHLTHTQTSHLKSDLAATTQQISAQLLKKQGLIYQIQLLKAKQKQKTKYSIKEEGCILKEQIKAKRRRIAVLGQELKQKVKSEEYLRKWTKELKGQLEGLKERHVGVKEEYQEEINKLSREIQEWNRKYKAQLIQQQNNPKKYPTQSPHPSYAYPSLYPSQSNPSNPPINPHFHTPTQPPPLTQTFKLVKLHQIDRLRKKLIFYAIENRTDPLGFVCGGLFAQGVQCVSLRELYRGLMGLGVFEEQQAGDVHKLARYILQDPNTTAKIPPEQTIPIPLATLILKNLLTSELTHQQIPTLHTQLKSFLLKTFDQIRHETWLLSGKSTSFVLANLRGAFAKYIKEEVLINQFTEYTEYLIWNKFGTGAGGANGVGCGEPYLLGWFEKVCEGLLGKKLVKDNNNRISKVNIRAIFDRLYDNNNGNCNVILGNIVDQSNANGSVYADDKIKEKVDKDNCQEIQWNDYCKEQ